MENMRRKNVLPFRLGCTSYVYPDDLLPNVEKLAPLFDDIEIVLFETEELSNLPDRQTISELKRISAEHGNTYTIHFPIDKRAAAADKSEREYFQQQALKIMRLTAPLEPFAYILHLEGVDKTASMAEQREWRRRAAETCGKIMASGLAESGKIALENLCYPPEWNKEIVEEFGFSYCIDVGHLWLYGQDWKGFLESHIEKARIVHLHGVSGNRDHLSIIEGDQSLLEDLIGILADRFRNVVTLEVFSREAAFGSARRIAKLCSVMAQ